jgi:hypothetical protein
MAVVPFPSGGSEGEHQLLAGGGLLVFAAQPGCALERLGEGQARRDPPVLAEECAEQIRAIALAAAVEEHDVVGEAAARGLGAVEDALDRGEGLLV